MTYEQAQKELRAQRIRELCAIQNCPVHADVHDITTITGVMDLDELEAHVESCRTVAIEAGQYAPLKLADIMRLYPIVPVTEL